MPKSVSFVTEHPCKDAGISCKDDGFMETLQKRNADIVHSDNFTYFVTPEKHQEILGRMNDLLDASGMTVAQLARVTSVSESVITRYFAGETKNPHLYTMYTLVLALGGNMDEIMGVKTPDASVETIAENPYGELLDSYREEARTLRTALEKITNDLNALTSRIIAMSKSLTIRTIALVIVIGIFCTLEIIDICNPDWGRYQWAVELFRSFLSNDVA